MFPFFLLIIAIAGGALLTYVYSPEMHSAARLCAGTCTGFVLLATVGFIAASLCGMGLAALAISAAVMVLPLLFLLREKYRAQIASDLAGVVQGIKQAVLHPGEAANGYALF